MKDIYDHDPMSGERCESLDWEMARDEFRAKRRARARLEQHCFDGMCGAEDCKRCNPQYGRGEDEE